MVRRRLVVLLVMIFCAALVLPGARAQEADPDAQEAVADTTWKDWFSGELELGMNLSGTDRESDIELDQLLRLSIDPPKHDNIHIRSSFWSIQDLDGHEAPNSILHTLNDAAGSTIQTRLLRLYLEIDDIGGDSTLRLGRQRIYDGIVNSRIDGAFYKWRRPKWSWYAYAGARASLYVDAHEDLRTGGGLSMRLPTKTQLALDVFYGDDDRRRFNTGATFNTISSVTVTQPYAKTHSAYGRATWNETELDELSLTAQGYFEHTEITYSASYRKQFSAIAERVNEVNEFFHLLGEFNEYQDFDVIVDVPVTKHFSFGLETQVHDAKDGNINSANRDYQRYGVSLNSFDLGGHYDTSVIVDYWDADDGEGQWTVTGEVSRDWEHTEAAIGVDYDRFQDRVTSFDPVLQDVFAVDSHENIYSFYVDFKRDISDRQQIQARAIFEDDNGPDSPYWRLRAQYTLRF